MNHINPKKLIEENPLFESLFAPVYFKANETLREASIIQDPLSVEVLERLDYDLSYFDKNTSGQFLVSVRTKILDDEVAAFIEENSNPVIINLGAGLDTRFSRMPIGKIRCWYDLDLPEVIDFRRNFFTESDRHEFIGKSALDFSWFHDVGMHLESSYLIVAEGLLMYFTEAEVQELIGQIMDRFPGSPMLCEIFHTKLINYNVQNEENTKEISFKWGVSETSAIEELIPGVHVVDEWKMFDYHKKRQKMFVRLLCAISPQSRQLVRILKLNLGEAKSN